MLHTASGQLAAVAPFDFAQSLRFIGGFGPSAGEQTLAGRTLTKAVQIGEQLVVFELADAGGSAGPLLRYTLHAASPIDAATQRAAEDRIAFFLSLNDDLGPFYALAEGDPAFEPIVRKLHGYHQVKFLTPFENAAWAVLTQRNSMAIARGLKQRLTERYGASLELGGTTYWAFPSAQALAQADPGELFDMLPNMRRAEYLQRAAVVFAGADEGWLRTAPYQQAEAWLRAIKGVGAWSASFILLRGLGRTERLPLGEEKMLAAASRAYGGGRAITQAEAERIAARYGAYQGYWAHYLRVGA